MQLSTLAVLLPILAASATTSLKVVKTSKSANGFNTPPRGFNTFGLQANGATNPSFKFDQQHVLTQAQALNSLVPSNQLQSGDYVISLDSGWSVGDHGDDNGRIIYDTSVFNITDMAAQLHDMGLKMGVYILPGAFCNDASKIIYGTNIPISATLSGNNNGFARCDFDFTKDGVQQWHNSVINLFAQWGVDFVKLDYITPGSPSNGGHLPPDNSGSVVAFHKAIQNSARPMRFDISWKLERSATYAPIWNSNADSMRTDQDINNSGSKTFVAWATVQRAIENYRQFITVVPPEVSTLMIHPDMDNLFVGNTASISGVSDAERTTMATHWIGAGANLLTGSDLTNLDTLGKKLLTWPAAWVDAAGFTAQYPMQPRNPGTGGNSAKQLQAWISGPNDAGSAYVVLVNYGPDQGQGGFGSKQSGTQTVKATWQDLGISGSYDVVDVWSGSDMGIVSNQLSASLGVGESKFYKLTKSS